MVSRVRKAVKAAAKRQPGETPDEVLRQVYCCSSVGTGLYCWKKLRLGACSTHGQRQERVYCGEEKVYEWEADWADVVTVHRMTFVCSRQPGHRKGHEDVRWRYRWERE